MRAKILDECKNRLCNIGDNLFSEIEETGIMIGHVEYFITNAPQSIRRKIYPNYKTNRRPNKWVNLVRAYLIEMGFAVTHPEYEADDLIFDRANELGEKNCIILTMDKDLTQIPGIHFNYYRPKVINEQGQKVSGDVNGLSLVTKEEAEYSFWISMITGDSGDNIKGIKGLGTVQAKKLLDGKTDLKLAVINVYKEYIGRDWEEEFEINYRLLKLGTKIK